MHIIGSPASPMPGGNACWAACALALLLAITSASTHAMDLNEYQDTAKRAIRALHKGKIRDVDEAIEYQRALIRLGVEAALEHAARSPHDAKLMHLVVLNAVRMQKLSLDEIERQWHDGRYLAAFGIDENHLQEDAIQKHLVGTIVHPATAIIALEQYRGSGDPALLEQVRDQVLEAVAHMEPLR